MKWNNKKGKIRAEANDLLFSIDADNRASYRNRNGAWVSEKFASIDEAKKWCESKRSDEHIAFLEESLRLNKQRLSILEERRQKEIGKKLVDKLVKHPWFGQAKKIWDAYVALPESTKPNVMPFLGLKYGEQALIVTVMRYMIEENDFLKGLLRWEKERAVEEGKGVINEA